MILQQDSWLFSAAFFSLARLDFVSKKVMSQVAFLLLYLILLFQVGCPLTFVNPCFKEETVNLYHFFIVGQMPLFLSKSVSHCYPPRQGMYDLLLFFKQKRNQYG